MLEIIVLDKDYQELGSITSFEGIRWTRKTKEPGNYEIVILDPYFALVMAGEYLVIDGKDETGMAEIIDYDEHKKKIILTGLFIEKKLDDRAIDSEQNLSDSVENSIRSLVTTFAMTGTRAIPHLELGTNNNLGETVSLQVNGVSLMKKVYEIANTYDMSIKLKYDYLQNKLIFSVWQGKDRTQNQTENSFAVFSENEGNVLSASYYRNKSDYKNFAYVIGNDVNDIPVSVTVDLRAAGEDLKEVFIEAKDIQFNATDGMTLAEYKDLLTQRGKEKLAEYKIVENILFEVNGNSNLLYKTDYDLGDKVTYQDDKLGVSADLIITEVTEIFEKNSQKIILLLGDDNKTEIEKVKREVL